MNFLIGYLILLVIDVACMIYFYKRGTFANLVGIEQKLLMFLYTIIPLIAFISFIICKIFLKNGTLTVERRITINSIDYEMEFKILRQMLIAQGMTEEYINNLIESGKIMGKLME